MILSIFSLFLAVMQIPNNQQPNTQEIQKHIDNQQNDSQAMKSTIPQNSNGPTQNYTNSPNDKNGQRETRIKITELPSVSLQPSKRNLIDWGYWFFSLLLVIVGSLQTFFLWKNVLATNRNALAAQAAAEASKTQAENSKLAAEAAQTTAKATIENTQLFMSKERARIKIEIDPETVPKTLWFEENTFITIPYKLCVLGITPAFVDDFIVTLVASASPDPKPFTTLAGSIEEKTLYPTQSHSMELMASSVNTIGGDLPDIPKAREKKQFIHFFADSGEVGHLFR